MINLFSKENLVLDYQWPETPQPTLFSGTPSRRIFDRFNGYQVLFIINAIAHHNDNFSSQFSKQLEALLSSHFNNASHSELSIFNALKNEDFKFEDKEADISSTKQDLKYNLQYRIWKMENNH